MIWLSSKSLTRRLSHGHPFLLQNMKTEEQQEEKMCKYIIKILNKISRILNVCHQCGNCNSETLEILRSLNWVLRGNGHRKREVNKVNNLIWKQDEIMLW